MRIALRHTNIESTEYRRDVWPYTLCHSFREDAARGADKRAEDWRTRNQVILHDVGGSGSVLTNIKTHSPYAIVYEEFRCRRVCIQNGPELFRSEVGPDLLWTNLRTNQLSSFRKTDSKTRCRQIYHVSSGISEKKKERVILSQLQWIRGKFLRHLINTISSILYTIYLLTFSLNLIYHRSRKYNLILRGIIL